jgi:hypothetical protein
MIIMMISWHLKIKLLKFAWVSYVGLNCFRYRC